MVSIVRGAYNLQHKIEKRFWPPKPPFGEWRLPLMVITMSSFIFILITAAFGVTINMKTGEVAMDMDWTPYIDKDTGAYDPWVYDPTAVWMSQNRTLIYITMFGMYMFCIAVFTYCWFEYNKWKWKNIPVEERKVIKYIKVKEPDNWLWKINRLRK